MNRREFLAASLAATSGLSAAGDRQSTAERPNVLIILSDDLAAWMVGCYGNKEIRTPNIDNLARTGMRFNNSFVCTPVCSPSRATFFTGLVPRQNGIQDFLADQPAENPPQGQKEPPPSWYKQVMLSDLLAQAGYDCGYIGKWHMGNDEKPGHGYRYTYTFRGGSTSYQDPTMYRNGEAIKEKGYLADLITKNACQFLDEQKTGKPFLLVVSHFNPHTPYTGHPQKYYDMYADTKFETFGQEPVAANALREKEYLKDTVVNIRKCAAATTALDDQVPPLLNKLRERGLWDKTLILFAGDNGYLLGRHGLWSKGLASNPINMYDEVVKVPLIMSWPGRIPTDAVAPEMVSFYDVMPTLCEAAGVTPPAGHTLCGRSFLRIARREKPAKNERWRNIVFGEFRNTEMARDTRYKVVVRNGGSGPNEMFDLYHDPREKNNVWDNPQFVSVRDALVKELAAWRQKTST